MAEIDQKTNYPEILPRISLAGDSTATEPFENQGLTKDLSPPWYSVSFFWASMALLYLGFVLNGPASYGLLVFVIPVFYGAHEAIHDTLVPRRGVLARGRSIHNTLALVLGCAIQGMNGYVARPAHAAHHSFGRSARGYSPDRVDTPERLSTRFVYYLRLFGVNAVAVQSLGFALLVFQTRQLPIRFPVEERIRTPYFFAAQLLVMVVMGLMIYLGGLTKLLFYELFFCAVWGLLQNVAHYGLKGIDKRTEVLCARSYNVGFVARLITFGTLHHLSHHVLPNIPSTYFVDKSIRYQVQKKLGCGFVVKDGIWSYLVDILRQFKGPLTKDQLSTCWLSNDGGEAGGDLLFKQNIKKSCREDKSNMFF